MKLPDYLRAERGTTQRLAADLRVSSSLVTQWGAGKPVAAERATQIEQATRGAVRRWDLRPTDWHLIWPELIGAEGAPSVPADGGQEVRDAA